MADLLSPSDRSSLTGERGPITMTVGGVLVFDGEVSRAEVLGRLEQRLHLIPRYRQRLGSPLPGVSNPVWVDDPTFDLEWHVRAAALPAPGGPDELAAFVGPEMARKLDRERPLWEVVLAGGLAAGRTAILMKMHHALVDGLAALGLAALLLDPTPEPLAVPAPEAEWEPRSYELADHVARLAQAPVGAVRRLMVQGAGRVMDTTPRRAGEELRRATDLVTELARSRPQAPMTPLNEPTTPNRRYALARADLASVKAAGRAAGGTVNDVVLAIVAGMLRRYLEQAGHDPTEGRPPVALVPVSVRREEEDGELGNRISTVFADLPVALADPAERIRTVGAEMRELKGSAAVRAGALMVGATGAAPPLVSSLLARGLGNVRAFNLVVSNVPGPQQPFYLAGTRLLETYPVVPLNPANQRLAVGVLSYDGAVFFGLLADRDLAPPLPVAAAALEDAIAETAGAAAPRR